MLVYFSTLAGECWRGLELSRKLSWSPNGLVLQEIWAYRVYRRLYPFVPGGVFKLKYSTGGVFTASIHHRHSFASHASDGHVTATAVLAWAKAIMEAIVEPKWVSSA